MEVIFLGDRFVSFFDVNANFLSNNIYLNFSTNLYFLSQIFFFDFKIIFFDDFVGAFSASLRKLWDHNYSRP